MPGVFVPSSAQLSPEVLDYLRARRSVPVKDIGGAGPSPEVLADILRIGTRVPDHGKLFPWYLLVIEGEARGQLDAIGAQIFARKNPDALPEALAWEQSRFSRYPVTIAVISRVREGKAPVWEQILSAGVVCYNLTLAASAHGFAANWVSDWPAYDAEFCAALGLEAGRDHVAGFIPMGTLQNAPAERDRPDPAALISRWTPGCAPAKGDAYAKPALGWPRAGFAFRE